MGFLKSTDYILDTTVTWAALEIYLKRSLLTEAQLGAPKAVFDIGEGIGYASRCGLGTCDWVGEKIEERLPERVVIKIPSAEPMRRLNASLPLVQQPFADNDGAWEEMEDGMRKAHNIEVATYEFFNEFDGLQMPMFYYGIPAERKCAHLGVGVEDLLRISLFALSAEERRASMPMLIVEMYGSLVEILDGADPPYSLAMQHLLSDLLFPHCVLHFATGCVSLITDKDTNIPEEEKSKRKEFALNKVLGSLEDVLHYHEKNKKNSVKFSQ